MIDLSNYNIYTNKDGRMRAYNKTTHAVTSYPRLLMELILGRPLLKTEDVHHKDENPLNNEIDNLEVMDHREHESYHAKDNKLFTKKKYEDKEMMCPICKKMFIWTARQQGNYYHKTKATENTRKYDRQPPCCSKSCAGKYATMIQYGYEDLETTLASKEKTCPICGKNFIWSTYSQWRFVHKLNEIKEPCCSMKCIHEFQRQNKEKEMPVSKICDTLKKNNGNITQTGKELNLSDNQIVRRLKNANLPYHSKDYKQ